MHTERTPDPRYIFRVVAVTKASGHVFESGIFQCEDNAIESAAGIQRDYPDVYSLELQKATRGQMSDFFPTEPAWFRY